MRYSLAYVELEREVEAMSQLAEKTWEEELKERFLREGKTTGEMSGLRFALQTLLEQRFQTLPAELLRQIMAADADRLKTAFTSALAIQSLDDLEL